MIIRRQRRASISRDVASTIEPARITLVDREDTIRKTPSRPLLSGVCQSASVWLSEMDKGKIVGVDGQRMIKSCLAHGGVSLCHRIAEKLSTNHE